MEPSCWRFYPRPSKPSSMQRYIQDWCWISNDFDLRHPTYILHTFGASALVDSRIQILHKDFHISKVNCFIYFVYAYILFQLYFKVNSKLEFDWGKPPNKKTNHFSCRYRCGTINQRADSDTLFVKLVRSANRNFVEAVQVKVDFLGYNCALW